MWVRKKHLKLASFLVFIHELLCFCVATEFSVNKDLYIKLAVRVDRFDLQSGEPFWQGVVLAGHRDRFA